MHEFLRAQGPWGQALTLHHTALDAARTAGDRLGEATALNDLGIMQYLTGDYPAATAARSRPWRCTVTSAAGSAKPKS